MNEPRKTNRRAFLKGKSAAEALTAAAEGLLPLAEPGPEAYLLRLARRAMACEFEVFLNAGQYAQGTPTACAVLDLVDELEDQLSIYRETSEISQVNRAAADEPQQLEPRLFALLSTALEITRATDGAFDLTAGRLAREWGFVRRSGALPSAEALAAARSQVGSQYIELDAAQLTIRFLRPGLELNLGSIGKGYALDRCAELFARAGIADYLLHGGHSSVLARGACAEPGNAAGWTVGLRNPLRPAQHLGQIRLNDRALATSGSGSQFFLHGGKRYGHLLDPRSGWPAEGVLSATAIAPSAAEADALSTAFYVLGPQRTQEFCRTRPEIAALLLCPGTGNAELEIHAFGLDGEFERL